MGGLMGATTADLKPKTLEARSASSWAVRIRAGHAYLRIALALVSLVALGLVGLNVYTVSRYSEIKPLVIRIDDVGRAKRCDATRRATSRNRLNSVTS
jgi:type IV secretory pathway TrbF-like protein